MRHYEILLLINPDQGNQIPAMLDKYITIVLNSGGKLHRNEDWGKLSLAYQINKLNKAHYVLLNVECNAAVIAELNNTFRFNDAIVRSLITKCDEAITEQSVFLKTRETEKPAKEPTKEFAKEANYAAYTNNISSVPNHGQQQLAEAGSAVEPHAELAAGAGSAEITAEVSKG